MEVALKLPGQEIARWEEWLSVARACERHGLALFASDHYVPYPRRTAAGAFDTWAVLAALAAATELIGLGTLVSPVTFRHPSVLAKWAVSLDHISGGRLEVGLGAGWFELEHRAYGFPFPERDTRLEMLAEQLEVVTLHWKGEPFSFAGRHYQLVDCPAAPPPVQRPRPRLIVGGSARPGTLRCAARFADEYNTFYVAPDACRRRRRLAAEAWRAAGRDERSLRFSLLTGCVVGRDRAELEGRCREVAGRLGVERVEDFLAEARPAWVIGTVGEARRRLEELAAAGVDRVMLESAVYEDLDMIELIGGELAPAVA